MSLITWSNGSLTASVAGLGYILLANAGMNSGKWYWEITSVSSISAMLGLKNNATGSYKMASGLFIHRYNGNLYGDGYDNQSYGMPAFGNTDIIGIAVDFDDGSVNFALNGVFYGSISKSFIANEFLYPAFTSGGSSRSVTVTANFGSKQFDIVTTNTTEWDRLVDAGYLPYDVENSKSWFSTAKYFIFDNGLYKTYDSVNNNWTTPINFGQQPTDVDYDTYGMDDINSVPVSVYNELSSYPNITFKKFTKKLEDQSTLDIIGTQRKPRLIFPTGDIYIGDVCSIKYVNLLSNIKNTGVVKVITSLDKGDTWYGFDATNNNFIQVNDITETTNYIDVEQYGMTSKQLQISDGISSDIWDSFRGDTIKNQTIRFAYYLYTPEIGDIAEVDQIDLCVDLRGYWNSTEETKQYIYTYSNNEVLVKLKDAGTYKINYYYTDPKVYKEGINSWNELEDKPNMFKPSQHNHNIAGINSLNQLLLGKSNIDHTHSELHSHLNKLALDSITLDESGMPLWKSQIWPSYIDKNLLINNFIDLKDTPLTYSGSENKVVKMKADGTSVEFVNIAYAHHSTGDIAGRQVARRYSILYDKNS